MDSLISELPGARYLSRADEVSSSFRIESNDPPPYEDDQDDDAESYSQCIEEEYERERRSSRALSEQDMTAGNVNGRDIHQRFRETLQSVSADPTKVKVVLASRITRGGIVSSQDSPTKRKERVEAARAIKVSKHLDQELMAAQRDAKQAIEAENEIKTDIRALERELQRVENEIHLAESRGPEKTVEEVQRRRKLRQDLSRLREEVSSAKGLHSSVGKDVADAQMKVSKISYALFQVQPEKEIAVEEEMETCVDNVVVMQARSQAEIDAVDRLESRRKKREESMREALAKEEEKKQSQIQQGKLGRRKAVERIRQHSSEVQHEAALLNRAHEQIHEKRAEAVVSLKENVDVVRDKIRSQVEARQRRKIKIEREREEERQRIVAAGGNPYEIFRRREMQALIVNGVEELAAKQKKREQEIAAKLRVEEDAIQRAASAHRRARETEEQFVKSMGRSYLETQHAQYIASHTKSGESVVDPTGRLPRIDPSKVMVAKDWKFGLGTAHKDNPEALELMKSKYPEVTAQSKTLPGTLKDERITALQDVVESSGNAVQKQIQLISKRTSAYNTVLKPPQSQSGFEDVELVEELADPNHLPLWNARSSQSTALDQNLEEVFDGVPKYSSSISRLERQYLERRRENAKKQIVQPQHVCGRTFEGSGFYSDPPEIYFKDFVVGTTYSKKFRLTNISLSFNSFKLIPIDDRFRDFFEISYELPGRMSAGMTCDLSISFHPKVNEDIDTVIPILTQTGPLNIPLRCSTKKMIPFISPHEEVGFGTVLIGERLTRSVSIHNRGALPFRFEIGGSALSLNDAFEDPESAAALFADRKRQEEADIAAGRRKRKVHSQEDEQYSNGLSPVFEFSVLSGEVEGYSKITIDITFTPYTVREYSSRIDIILKPANVLQAVSLSLTAAGGDVPMIIEKDVIDLKCMFYNTLYRENLILSNRGKTALRAEMEVPRSLSPFLEFVPDVCYVQAGSSLEVHLKFTPTADFAHRCAPYIIENVNSNVRVLSFEAPLRVRVPDQAMPLFFRIRGEITPDDLEIEPKELDFGSVYLTEGRALRVWIQNRSSLPQRFGFTSLPREILISPDRENGAIGNLLPGERKYVDVVFTPFSATLYDFSIQCSTGEARKTNIQVHGIGEQMPLQLSCSRLHLRSTAIGDVQTHTLYLRNVDRRRSFSYQFQILSSFSYSSTSDQGESSSGNYSNIPIVEVKPSTGTIAPLGEAIIVVSFRAFAPKYMDLKGNLPLIEAVRELASDSQSMTDDTKHEEVVSPIDYDPSSHSHPPSTSGKSSASLARSIEPIDRSWGVHESFLVPFFVEGFESPQHLEIFTTVVQAGLVAFISGDITQNLEFGEVAAGREKLVTCRLVNRSDYDTDITIPPLDPYGLIPAHTAVDFSVRFSPLRSCSYAISMTIGSTRTNQLILYLSGRGVSPSIRITPSESEFDLGDLYCVSDLGALKPLERTKRSLALANDSDFDVPVSVDLTKMSTFNENGLLPLMVDPMHFVVPAHAEKRVNIEFVPDRTNTEYGGDLELSWGGKSDTNAMRGSWKTRIRGRCWSSSLFVRYPTERRRERGDDLRFNGSQSTEDTFVLDFGTIRVGDTSTRSLIVGNVLSNESSRDRKGANGEALLDPLSSVGSSCGFRIDQPKLTLEVGSSKQLSFSLTPSPAALELLPVPGIEVPCEIEVGGRLRGGMPQTDTGFRIILRAVVRPM